MMKEIHSCPELIEAILQMGFLPLLDSGIRGYSAEEMADEDCRYVVFSDGGWDWPLWKWKGPVVTEGDCVYGKFFAGKAGFISREWWPDFYNYRRSSRPAPGEGSIEETILLTLEECESLITRELRAACGFDGPKMRSKFDGYVTRLQMACRIITEDFVYPTDKHGREYGSVEFADALQRWMNAGTRTLAFVIGGAFGFSKEVYDAVPHRMSLSRMTFNHQMVRLFFVEQLYRAHTILRHEKYHNA